MPTIAVNEDTRELLDDYRRKIAKEKDVPESKISFNDAVKELLGKVK